MEFLKKKEIKADIQNVKVYGRIWGKILTLFGFASKTDEGIYVNRRSFFQHLVEAWCSTHGKAHKLRDRVKINEMAKNIEKDKNLGLSHLTAEKVEQIFLNCNMKYITTGILGEEVDQRKIFGNL